MKDVPPPERTMKALTMTRTFLEELDDDAKETAILLLELLAAELGRVPQARSSAQTLHNLRLCLEHLAGV